MFLYLFKRILLFIPTLVLVSFLAFGLSKCTPGDPVEQYLEFRGVVDDGGYQSAKNRERRYQQTAQLLNLDKPNFYFTFTSAAYPDTLYRYIREDQQTTLKNLIAQYGNWPLIEDYYHHVRDF